MRCTVPQLHCKDDLSDEIKRSLTLELLEEKCPQEAWTQVYTDGSATDATKNGGAGVYVHTPDGNTYSESIPTGTNCTNYRAEVEALILAANMLKDTTYEQVVFLTDAQLVLEAIPTGKLPDLHKALNELNCFRLVFQWIPSHCGVPA